VTERRPADKADGQAAAGKPGTGKSGSGGPGDERVVVRDKRKIDSGTGKARPTKPDGEAGPPASAPDGAVPEGATPSGGAPAASEVPPESGPTSPESSTAPAPPAQRAEPGEGAAAGAAEPDAQPPAEVGTELGPLGAELEALRSELDERTRDLQRVSAEYANYRKRVDRDRALVGEQATGVVLAALLPVLDDLDRAREHGDLVGPFAVVAEQLTTALGKFGLTPFGEQGDRFDPTRHDAVAHQTSPDVAEPTCVEVMRRGYLLGERLLRPALVAVADPE
jgi:molecular chaperone GrpE